MRVSCHIFYYKIGREFIEQGRNLRRVLRFVDEDGVTGLARVVAILKSEFYSLSQCRVKPNRKYTYGVGGHEVTGASNWALLSEAGDLAAVVDLIVESVKVEEVDDYLVVLEDSELLLLSLMLVLLGGGVLLLLALLTTTTKAEDQVKGGLLLSV